MKSLMKHGTVASLAAVLFAGCAKSADSFSLLSDEATFKQSTSFSQRPVDILWVIDNSGSMDISQRQLADNFQSFINRFSSLGYDFRMAVTTTDAYRDYHYGTTTRSRLKDRGRDTKGTLSNCGDDSDLFTGIRVMDKNTPNLNQVFLKNITQGVCGSGDERGLSSMEMALSNPQNADFHRPGAFLSVIIVSDEKDLSYYDWQNGTSSYSHYDYLPNPKPALFPISRFTDFLNTLTGSVSGGVRNYSVSTIAVLDQACADELNAADSSGFDRTLGTRYAELADATQGTKGSLCEPFGDTLSTISEKIVNLSSVFKLDREPVVETILVKVDGRVIPQDGSNGWTYDASTVSIQFHGSAIPAGGADIKIFFDPTSVKL